MDELVNAWVTDENTPFRIALLGMFDAGPLRRPDGTVDVPRIRRELTARAHRVPALGRRVVWTPAGEGRPVWAADRRSIPLVTEVVDPDGSGGGGDLRPVLLPLGPGRARSAQRSSGR